jgi:hypothetical protein
MLGNLSDERFAIGLVPEPRAALVGHVCRCIYLRKQTGWPWVMVQLAVGITPLDLHGLPQLRDVVSRFFYSEKIFGKTLGEI